MRQRSWPPQTSGAMGHLWQPMAKCSEYGKFKTFETSLVTDTDTPLLCLSLRSALCAALLISHAIAGSLATKFVARIQYLYVSLNIAYVALCRISLSDRIINTFGRLFLVVIIVIPTVTPTQFRNKASYALGHFENGTQPLQSNIFTKQLYYHTRNPMDKRLRLYFEFPCSGMDSR